MKHDNFLSLKDAQQQKRMTTQNFYRWLEKEKISLHYELPGDKKIIIGSQRYFDLVANGASSDDLNLHMLRGGVNETENYNDGIGWLLIPNSKYKTLFASGSCCINYFFEGLKASENGLKTIRPEFKNKLPFNRILMPNDAIFYLTNKHTSTPHTLNISLEDVHINHDELLRLSHEEPSDGKASNHTLPTYKYASKKLYITLETWRKFWHENFTTINNKTITDKKSLKKNTIEASEYAKDELKILYASKDYQGEKYKNLHDSIAKIIHPDFSIDNPKHWFDKPISNGIYGMIQASNRFWSDLNHKQYGIDLHREEIQDYLMIEYQLSFTDADNATRIIQPDHITRGKVKLNRS